MTAPEEQAVITAARTMAEEGVNDHWTACAVVVAVAALDAKPAAEPAIRRFLITYLYGVGASVISARAFATASGPVTEETVRGWEDVIAATLPDGHRVALTSFTELEA